MSIKKLAPLLLTLHVLVAGFFLPFAIIFAITGGLYTFGIRGQYETKNLELTLELPADPKLSELTERARLVLLESFKAAVPSGEPALKKMGTSWQFEWTGARADFTIEPTANPGVFKVSHKETGWHRFFVQLHKAKGGMPFKVLAGGLAVALLLLFASGAGLAFSRPREKTRFLYSLAIGFFAFALGVYIS